MSYKYNADLNHYYYYYYYYYYYVILYTVTYFQDCYWSV